MLIFHWQRTYSNSICMQYSRVTVHLKQLVKLINNFTRFRDSLTFGFTQNGFHEFIKTDGPIQCTHHFITLFVRSSLFPRTCVWSVGLVWAGLILILRMYRTKPRLSGGIDHSKTRKYIFFWRVSFAEILCYWRLLSYLILYLWNCLNPNIMFFYIFNT